MPNDQDSLAGCCPQCYNEVCTCGHEYRYMCSFELAKFIAVLENLKIETEKREAEVKEKCKKKKGKWQ